MAGSQLEQRLVSIQQLLRAGGDGIPASQGLQSFMGTGVHQQTPIRKPSRRSCVLTETRGVQLGLQRGCQWKWGKPEHQSLHCPSCWISVNE